MALLFLTLAKQTTLGRLMAILSWLLGVLADIDWPRWRSINNNTSRGSDTFSMTRVCKRKESLAIRYSTTDHKIRAPYTRVVSTDYRPNWALRLNLEWCMWSLIKCAGILKLALNKFEKVPAVRQYLLSLYSSTLNKSFDLCCFSSVICKSPEQLLSFLP